MEDQDIEIWDLYTRYNIIGTTYRSFSMLSQNSGSDQQNQNPPGRIKKILQASFHQICALVEVFYRPRCQPPRALLVREILQRDGFKSCTLHSMAAFPQFLQVVDLILFMPLQGWSVWVIRLWVIPAFVNSIDKKCSLLTEVEYGVSGMWMGKSVSVDLLWKQGGYIG